MQETRDQSLGCKDPLEKEWLPPSSICAWRIPWTEEPGGLQSMRSQRVEHDWAINTPLACSTVKVFSLKTLKIYSIQFSSVTQSCPTLLQPHGLQHTGSPCPLSTARVYSNSCPLSWWCHSTILSSVVPFSSCPQSFSASGSFQMSRFFIWGGQSIGVSA